MYLLKQLLQSSKNLEKNRGAQCFDLQMMKNEPLWETEMFATNEQNEPRCAMFRP